MANTAIGNAARSGSFSPNNPTTTANRHLNSANNGSEYTFPEEFLDQSRPISTYYSTRTSYASNSAVTSDWLSRPGPGEYVWAEDLEGILIELLLIERDRLVFAKDVGSKLGRGGQSVVYRGMLIDRPPTMNKVKDEAGIEVAVKVLKCSTGSNDTKKVRVVPNRGVHSTVCVGSYERNCYMEYRFPQKHIALDRVLLRRGGK